MTTLNFRIEERALRNPYSYARSTIAVQEVIVVEISRQGQVGRGECSPYSSFFERPTQEVVDQIKRVQAHIGDSFDRFELLQFLPAGPARCAIDCALWDLEAKLTGRPVYELAARARPLAVSIAYTIGLDNLDVVQKTAERAAHLPILKIKGGQENDAERVQIIRQAAPHARLTIDPNGGWSFDFLKHMIPVLEACNIEMLEQPLTRGEDHRLAEITTSIPIFADESFSDDGDFKVAAAHYDGINIKLDKCGGLTAGYNLVDKARHEGLKVMIGCLGGTSLSAAPGMLVAAYADFVDLDSQLWHLNDREPALPYNDGVLSPGTMAGWGGHPA
ncbi:dipeptide epimerase [Pseudomonas chlororaphis]|nr:dipeptide epimerase [Pseudomonas chlororaphis]